MSFLCTPKLKVDVYVRFYDYVVINTKLRLSSLVLWASLEVVAMEGNSQVRGGY